MRIFAYFILTSMLVSCGPSLRFYTEDIHDDNRWSNDELSQIQFYVSDDIVLWRDIKTGESVVKNGKIRTIDGRSVEEVVIKRGTKGQYLFSPKSNQYAVSFDDSDNSKYLIFGPNEKVNNRYVLLAKDWNRSTGKISYGDYIYNTSNESAFAYLMVDYDKRQHTKVSSRIAKGRTVK
jgi:hypothetical protein